MNCHVQANPYFGLTIMPFDRSEQFAQLLRVKYCGTMFRLRCDQCTAQVGGDIPLGAPGGNRVAEDGPECAAQPIRGFISAARLDRPQNVQ